MNSAVVSGTLDAQGVLHIRLEDSAGANGLTEALIKGLTEQLAVARTPATKVVVLSGLPDVFCSGATLELLSQLTRGELNPSELLLPRLLLETPVPVIAAMEGSAVGGGFALALAADLIVLARESRYGFNFMDLGFTPGMGSTRLAEHVLSPAVAHELLYTGEMRKGAAFAGCAGINAVLPRKEVLEHAGNLAARIAEKPREALELLKLTLSSPRRQWFEESRTLESLMHHVTFRRPDLQKQIEAMFVSHKPPGSTST